MRDIEIWNSFFEALQAAKEKTAKTRAIWKITAFISFKFTPPCRYNLKTSETVFADSETQVSSQHELKNANLGGKYVSADDRQRAKKLIIGQFSYEISKNWDGDSLNIANLSRSMIHLNEGSALGVLITKVFAYSSIVGCFKDNINANQRDTSLRRDKRSFKIVIEEDQSEGSNTIGVIFVQELMEVWTHKELRNAELVV